MTVVCDTGESLFEVEIEADSNDIIEYPHSDKSRNPHLCTVCVKHFQTKQKLKQHKRMHVEKIYSCAVCEKGFATQRDLRLHIKNVHSSKYKCTECGKCFSSKLTLTRHRRIQSGEKPF